MKTLNGIVFSLVGIAPSSRWTLQVMQRVGAVVEFGKGEAPGGRSSAKHTSYHLSIDTARHQTCLHDSRRTQLFKDATRPKFHA